MCSNKNIWGNIFQSSKLDWFSNNDLHKQIIMPTYMLTCQLTCLHASLHDLSKKNVIHDLLTSTRRHEIYFENKFQNIDSNSTQIQHHFHLPLKSSLHQRFLVCFSDYKNFSVFYIWSSWPWYEVYFFQILFSSISRSQKCLQDCQLNLGDWK